MTECMQAQRIGTEHPFIVRKHHYSHNIILLMLVVTVTIDCNAQNATAQCPNFVITMLLPNAGCTFVSFCGC